MLTRCSRIGGIVDNKSKADSGYILIALIYFGMVLVTAHGISWVVAQIVNAR